MFVKYSFESCTMSRSAFSGCPSCASLAFVAMFLKSFRAAALWPQDRLENVCSCGEDTSFFESHEYRRWNDVVRKL